MDQSSCCWDEITFLPQISDTLFHFHFTLFTSTFAPKLPFSNFVLHNFISPRLQPSFHSTPDRQKFSRSAPIILLLSAAASSARCCLCVFLCLVDSSEKNLIAQKLVEWQSNVSGAIDPMNIIHHSTIKTCWWDEWWVDEDRSKGKWWGMKTRMKCIGMWLRLVSWLVLSTIA